MVSLCQIVESTAHHCYVADCTTYATDRLCLVRMYSMQIVKALVCREYASEHVWQLATPYPL
jgi:hypothetical protein